MRLAYVDTSCLVAIVFGEPGSEDLALTLESYDVLASCNLLEAELRSALAREAVPPDPAILYGITWILPERRLTPEFDRVLAERQLRGADLWHVACALYVAESPADVAFATLDEKQQDAADALGFASV